MPETALVSFRTLAFFFPLVTSTCSSCNGTHCLSIFDHCSFSILPCLASKFRNWSFWSFLLFTMVCNLMVGNRYLLMNLHVVQFQYVFELRGLAYSQIDRLSWISSEEIFDMDSRTSSHLVSNPEYYRHEGWQRIKQRNPVLCHERESLEGSRRSWRRSVFLVETCLPSGLSVSRDWPFSWIGNSGWSCPEQKQSSRPASRNLEKSQKTDREDFNSSNESTISTSLIYNIVSDGKSEQGSHLISESYLLNKEWWWFREFVELQLWNLLSLLSNRGILREVHRYCGTHSRGSHKSFLSLTRICPKIAVKLNSSGLEVFGLDRLVWSQPTWAHYLWVMTLVLIRYSGHGSQGKY